MLSGRRQLIQRSTPQWVDYYSKIGFTFSLPPMTIALYRDTGIQAISFYSKCIFWYTRNIHTTNNILRPCEPTFRYRATKQLAGGARINNPIIKQGEVQSQLYSFNCNMPRVLLIFMHLCLTIHVQALTKCYIFIQQLLLLLELLSDVIQLRVPQHNFKIITSQNVRFISSFLK